jgi:HEAT repeat protein/predicted RNA-binding Zn-ribbon protein involved in translation (DUF1610 family)
MAVQTISLSCPTCGNSSNISAKKVRFGYEFTCPFCSATSVMIIDKQLYAPKPGEVICPQCGNVNPPGARFCSCGALLIEKCHHCFREFAVGQVRCPHCGRLQLSGAKQDQLEEIVQSAIQMLSSTSEAERLQACEDLRMCGSLSAPAIPALNGILKKDGSHRVRTAVCQVFSAVGRDENVVEEIVPALIDALKDDFNDEVWRSACETLETIGPRAAAVVPVLCQIIGNEADDVEIRAKACHTLVAVGASAGDARAVLGDTISRSADAHVQRAAWEVLSKLDPKAGNRALQDLVRNGAKDWTVRHSACEMLYRIDPRAAIALLRELVSDPDSARKHKGQSVPLESSPDTLRELGELDMMMREASYKATCELLVKLDLKTAVNTLSDVVKHDKADWQSKKVVCQVLGEIGAAAAEAVPALIDMLKEHEYLPIAYVSLKGIGEPALPALESLTGLFAPGEQKRAARDLIDEIHQELRNNR